MDLNDLDAVVQMLDDKIVRTENGAYISIADLKSLKADFEEMKRRERDGDPTIKTFADARAAAKRNPELMKFFQEKDTPSGTSPDSAVKET